MFFYHREAPNNKRLIILNDGMEFIHIEIKINVSKVMLPLFQITSRFGFSMQIVSPMHLDIGYVKIHSKIYVSRKARTTYNLEWREYKSCTVYCIA